MTDLIKSVSYEDIFTSGAPTYRGKCFLPKYYEYDEEEKDYPKIRTVLWTASIGQFLGWRSTLVYVYENTLMFSGQDDVTFEYDYLSGVINHSVRFYKPGDQIHQEDRERVEKRLRSLEFTYCSNPLVIWQILDGRIDQTRLTTGIQQELGLTNVVVRQGYATKRYFFYIEGQGITLEYLLTLVDRPNVPLTDAFKASVPDLKRSGKVTHSDATDVEDDDQTSQSAQLDMFKSLEPDMRF